MEIQILRPINRVINIKGRVLYNDNHHTWNTIRFKKEIVNEFPQLKERRANFSYKMVFYENYDDFEKEFRRLRRNKEPLPILLFLCREKQEIPN